MGRGSGQGSGGGGGTTMTAGVHAGVMTGDSPGIRLDRQTSNLLKSNPLMSVKFSQVIEEGALGFYNPSSGVMQIAIKPGGVGGGGSGKLGGDAWSTSMASKTEKAAIQTTAMHEIGHHLHVSKAAKSLTDPVESMYNKRLKTGNFITQYAKTDKYEFFAESFAAYKRFPSELKKKDPELFQSMRTYLKNYGKD